VTPRASPFSISSTSSTATVAPRMPYTSAISRPSPLAPPVMTMTSSLRSTSRGIPNASLLLMAPKIQDSDTKAAQAIETSMGGASQNMFWARKQSGTIHAMKGWKKLVLSTLTSISIESGANHESRCGAVAYGGGIVVVELEEVESELFDMRLIVRQDEAVHAIRDVVKLPDYRDELGGSRSEENGQQLLGNILHEEKLKMLLATALGAFMWHLLSCAGLW
jgi:hypothetical protein